MMRKQFFRSMTFKRFLLILCGVYLCMVLLFHNRLQIDRHVDAVEDVEVVKITATTTKERVLQPDFNNSVEGLKVWVQNYYSVKTLAKEIHQLEQRVDQVKGELIVHTTTPPKKQSMDKLFDKQCMRPAEESEFNAFRELERGVYVYSAFLDDRKNVRYLRFIMLVAKDKKHKFTLTCVFGDGSQTHATAYEMCENHNKQYGGYIYSCPVTNKTICPLRVKTEAEQRLVSMPVVPVAKVMNPYQYGVCIPPLFGKIKKDLLVEFIELTTILGAEQFYFYNFSLTPEMTEILKYYQEKGRVAILPWHLPKEVGEKSIWYHGQLLAHNDCMYRAMSTMKYMSINDMDEFIIPHTAAKTWDEFIPGLVGEKHCGISFSSAFYDPNHGITHPSGLHTMGHTVRSEQISHVRTKVMLKPERVFEVGIHHISKQNEEKWTPVKVHPDIAYLHHYRRCVANYGMKCSNTREDRTVFKYFDQLQTMFDKSMTFVEDVLSNMTVVEPVPKDKV